MTGSSDELDQPDGRLRGQLDALIGYVAEQLDLEAGLADALYRAGADPDRLDATEDQDDVPPAS